MAKTSYSEREILALLGDPKTQRRGFEMMVAQYSEQLYWQIRRMVLSHEDANDLLQNTFVKAWTNIDNFRAEAKVSTWLYRIASSGAVRSGQGAEHPHLPGHLRHHLSGGRNFLPEETG